MTSRRTRRGVPGGDFDLSPDVVAALQVALPSVAERTMAAVIADVSEYASMLGSAALADLEQAVHAALAGFLHRVTEPRDRPTAAPPAGIEAAYALGRVEARAGRTIDPLLSAYRVGAGASWRGWAEVLNSHNVPGPTVARFAEFVFAYIDELSAASVAGHSDALASTGRARAENTQRLARALLEGAHHDRLVNLATHAEWRPPATLTAAIVATPHIRNSVAFLKPGTLVVAGDVAGTPDPDETGVLLIPDATRSLLWRAPLGSGAVVGPTRPWVEVSSSFARAVRIAHLHPGRSGPPIDCDESLVELIVTADREAVRDLRARVLSPLDGLRPDTAQRLAETMRSWLLHQGRRNDVAADLHVHPQTVRYRVGQLRDLFGERMTSPESVLELLIALAAPA